MLTIRAMTGGEGYAKRHLEHSDYYDQGRQISGEWMGQAAEQLRLRGKVREEQFEAIRQGLDPHTGEFLRVRQSADRIAENGTTLAKARAFYDATFSAPKSVSIQATLGQDERILEAWQHSVQRTVEHLEREAAATRVRLAGANEDRYTGNVVAALYHHDSSRELDPQLHTHALFFNLTYDATEGRWKALQFSEAYQDRAYFTEIQRNYFANELQRLGYELDNRPDRSQGFEIRGVSQEMIERYSQRSEQRDAAIRKFTEAYGRAPTDNEVAVLVRETRPDKLAEISTEEVRARMTARLKPGEQEHLFGLREQARVRAQIEGRAQSPDVHQARQSLEYGKEHLFERVSVARDREILAEALQHGRGQLDLDHLKGYLAADVARGAVLKAGREMATQQSLWREQQMIAIVNHGIGRYERLGTVHEFIVSDQLRPEQKQAVEFTLNSHDLAINLRGAAGTGKTATLSEIRHALHEAGQDIVAIAPTNSAVEELKTAGFEDAITVERLLQDKRTQEKLRGQVLLVDEAGMVSSRQMSELVRLVEHKSGRLILSGDTRQIQSVEAGDALRVLERESHLKSFSLSQVQRQSVEAYRQAVEELRQAPARGYERLERMGAIHEVPYFERPWRVAEAYRQAQQQSNAKGLPSHVLVVAPTHDEIQRITETIRADRIQRGELGPNVSVSRHVSLNWTEAQKRDMRRYEQGQVLEFHKAVRGVARHESLDIVHVDKQRLIARKADGTEREITAKQAKAFSVWKKQDIHLAAGDRLQLEASRRDSGFRATNGELVTVSRIDEQGHIYLEDGRVLPDNYHQFRHGYAVTAHRSQGKTVDHVIVSGDQMSKELFYVAATRGRESVEIYTSDSLALQQSIGISGERRSATELARDTSANFFPGNGMTAGFEMSQRAARDQLHTALNQPPEKRDGIEHTQSHTPELEQSIDYGIGI